MMLGQRASGADWHFRKIALAGEDWGRITSYEGTATGSRKVSVVLSREARRAQRGDPPGF